ncbi:MAG TPA: hypothetical protein VK498_06070 [Ferruginibacter sp.]|nr:hypothetical protein [Ferruginibacter sp.]
MNSFKVKFKEYLVISFFLIAFLFGCKIKEYDKDITGRYSYKNEILYVYANGTYEHKIEDSTLNKNKWYLVDSNSKQYVFEHWKTAEGTLDNICKNGCKLSAKFYNNAIYLLPDIDLIFVKRAK